MRGCLLAGAGLLLLAFLPPAVVLSAIAQPSWPGVADAKQVVPQALSLAAADLAAAAGPIMLGVLDLAAPIAETPSLQCCAPWCLRSRRRGPDAPLCQASAWPPSPWAWRPR